MNQQINTKSNWIAFIGAPNAGKSTLLNRIIGTKISIVSPKVQTTRTLLKGIKVIGDTQLVFAGSVQYQSCFFMQTLFCISNYTSSEGDFIRFTNFLSFESNYLTSDSEGNSYNNF